LRRAQRREQTAELGERLDAVGADAGRDACLRAEQVRQHAAAVHARAREDERGTALEQHAARQLRDLELRAHGLVDHLQVAAIVEELEELAQIGERAARLEPHGFHYNALLECAAAPTFRPIERRPPNGVGRDINPVPSPLPGEMQLKFTKMNGLGYDFRVVEWPAGRPLPNAELVRSWADRRFGVGFDQLLLIEHDRPSEGDARYRLYHADGGEVEQCGNG